MKKLLIFIPLIPLFANAETTADVDSLIGKLGDWITYLVPIVISLAILAFLWGVFLYVVASSDEDKTKGKSIMIWGVVGIFVMVSVWGLVNVIQNTFGITSDDADIPTLIPPILNI